MGIIQRIPPLALAVLMLGFVSQVGQVLLLRELLMLFHGNELSIGIILSAWMCWVGLGSWLGAWGAERTRRHGLLLAVTALAMLPVLPATLFIVRTLRGFFDLPPGVYLSLPDIALSSFTLSAPVGLLLGVQFVLLSRLWRERVCQDNLSGTSRAYIVEAAGNLLGGVLFTFVLVHWLNAFQTAVAVGIFMLVAVLWTGRKCGGQLPAGVRRAGIAALLAAGAAAVFLDDIDRWGYGIQWRHLAPQHSLLETHQSRYGAIAVLRRDDQYSFFQSGHLVFSAAGPETTMPGLEEQEAAVLAHFAMVQHARPERVLLIGGGLRGTLNEIIKHPLTRVDYVELDETLTRAAREHVGQATLAALTDPRVRLIHGDGRLFVRTTTEKYDLILVDVPDPATAALNRYYTQEFFRQAQRRLNPDGIVAIGAVSTAGLRGVSVANRNATIYHTLASVFDVVLPVGDRFVFYFASDSQEQILTDAAALQRRYLERNIQADGFSHHHFAILLEPSQLRRLNWMIRNHGRRPEDHLRGPQTGPLLPDSVKQQKQSEPRLPPVRQELFINSDLKPIGYYYTLMFWADTTRAGQTDLFAHLLRIEPGWVWPAAGVVIAIGLILRGVQRIRGGRPDAKYAVMIAVFMTGFSAMMLQIAVLFSFQSLYGFIYEKIGMIVAIFMGGLAVGAACTHRHAAKSANLNALAAVQLVIAAAALGFAAVMPRIAAVESAAAILLLFSLLTFVSGLFSGANFPLAAECYRTLNGRSDRSTGVVYAMELFGACLGAALASVAVAPLLGIVMCGIVAAAANGTALAALMTARRSHA